MLELRQEKKKNSGGGGHLNTSVVFVYMPTQPESVPIVMKMTIAHCSKIEKFSDRGCFSMTGKFRLRSLRDGHVVF